MKLKQVYRRWEATIDSGTGTVPLLFVVQLKHWNFCGQSLNAALVKTFRYDSQAIVEPCVKDILEVTCRYWTSNHVVVVQGTHQQRNTCEKMVRNNWQWFERHNGILIQRIWIQNWSRQRFNMVWMLLDLFRMISLLIPVPIRFTSTRLILCLDLAYYLWGQILRYFIPSCKSYDWTSRDTATHKGIFTERRGFAIAV